MSAERIYRAALLAYPRSYRRERGDEIVATVLDGGQSVRADELVSLLLGGIACRGRLASGGSWPASMRAGIRLGAYVLLWLNAVATATWAAYDVKLGFLHGINARFSVVELAGAGLNVLALLALSRGRWLGPLVVALATQAVRGAVVGVDWTVWPWHANGGHTQFMGIRWIAVQLLLFVPALLVALTRPRPGEPEDRRSAAWALAVLPVAALLAWGSLFLTSWLGWPIAVLLIVALLAGRRDPRLAAAGATVAGLGAVGVLVADYSLPWLGSARFLGLGFALVTLALAARAAHARRLPA